MMITIVTFPIDIIITTVQAVGYSMLLSYLYPYPSILIIFNTRNALYSHICGILLLENGLFPKAIKNKWRCSGSIHNE